MKEEARNRSRGPVSLFGDAVTLLTLEENAECSNVNVSGRR